MEAESGPVESSASTADKPGTAELGAFRTIVIMFLVLVQCGFAWLFVGDWQINLEARLDGSASVPVLVSAATAVLVVGTVAMELVLFLRRRRDPVKVALAGMVLMQLAELCESVLDF